jgi:hypothetical protein
MKQLFFILMLFLFYSCASSSEKQPEENPIELKQTPASKEVYTVMSVQNSDQTWGYQILKDGKLIIDQKNIPAVQGNYGFRTQADAQKTGEFVLLKIQNGDFPPTISIEELENLEVLSE